MSAIDMTQVRSVEPADKLLRFNLGQRIEHYLLIVSFTALAITGIPQKFSSMGWAAWIINDVFNGIDLIRTTHHFFAYMLLAEGAYHVGILFVSAVTGRMRNLAMLPSPRDLFDVINMFRYFLGRGKHPRFGRYSYKEKAEYWALIWGTAVMAFTGFMLLFPVAFTIFIPGNWIPAAKAAHGGEAILAVLAIVTWHFYNAHFNPKIYPFDTSMFSGTISKERMLEEHPLEYERMFGKEAAAEMPAAPEPDLVTIAKHFKR